MKSLNKILLTAIAAIVAAGIFASCKKDDGGGTPVIHYVRITSPASSDSLLVSAGQGQLIAIMGENLGATVQVWFNDQKATLTPTFITNTSILVSVPSQIPMEITNKIKLIFKNGDSLLYDFTVDIGKPVVSSADCEYVPEGSSLVIHGTYFYAPVTVSFTGGAVGEVTEISDDNDIITVTVPSGVQPGPVTVTTNFGSTESDFWFDDTRNIFISSDPYEGWWNSSYVVYEPASTDPPKINGNYIRVTMQMSSWSWNEIAGGPASSMPIQCKNIPDDAILHPEDYYFKFEINTIKPYDGSTLRINAALNAGDNDNYQWAPPYDSEGEWKTVVIPWEDMVASYTTKPVINPDGYWCRILMQGAAELDCDICFDNFRIVPKVNQ
ncbi:glycan-binding surface protein [Parafilimonas sp.]|uniref:glycan-binding surface protein n=1 Tax=Parafilimonas sp. TaxID=1969739 RepID=UPI0039E7092D